MATRQLLGELAFTHEWYKSFLTHLKEEGYSFETFPGTLEEETILLRHDVDLSLSDALAMAEIEAEVGVEATYCIFIASPLYNLFDGENIQKIHEIQSLDHDIALHFSTHNYWPNEQPSKRAVETQVNKMMDVLRTVTPDISDAVSFHRPPDWVLETEFETFINTYSQRYFSDITYISESNQRWRTDQPDFEDLPEQMQILVHPGLWSERDDEFEKRLEQGVVNSCRYVNRRAQEEFIEPNKEN